MRGRQPAIEVFGSGFGGFTIGRDGKAVPHFVPLAEEGWVAHPVRDQVAHIHIDEVFRDGLPHPANTARSRDPAARNTGVLLLGRKRYPLIRLLLRRVVCANAEIVDSAESPAAQVAELVGKDCGKRLARLRDQFSGKTAPSGKKAPGPRHGKHRTG
jgi:glutamate racemase